MKKLYWMLVIMCPLIFATQSIALGPVLLAPHQLTCDPPVTSENVTGTYVYYREVGAQFTNANRLDAGKIWETPFDLLTKISLGNGNWELAASFYNETGESGLSNILPFPVAIPSAPKNLTKH